MANSFNISVKPEIATLEAKVDIVDTIVDLIRGTDVVNLGNAITANNTILADLHDTDIPANLTAIGANNTILADLHDTDIPSNLTAIGANNTILADLHDTDIPALDTQILTRQKRSHYSDGYLDDSLTEWTTLVESTGKGTLLFIQIRCRLNDAMIFKLQIDSATYNEIAYASATWVFTQLDIGVDYARNKWKAATTPFLYNIRFDTLLKVSAAPGNGSGKAAAHVIYCSET